MDLYNEFTMKLRSGLLLYLTSQYLAAFGAQDNTRGVTQRLWKSTIEIVGVHKGAAGNNTRGFSQKLFQSTGPGQYKRLEARTGGTT